MTPDSLFSLFTGVAVVGWLCLLASLVVPPGARRALRLVGGRAIPMLLAIAYLVALVSGWPAGQAVGGGFGSLAEVTRLFTVPMLLLAGWIHYLAFDLLVGRWQIDDAGVAGRAAWWLLPCLVLTFLAGPVGFLLYLALRAARRRR